MINEKSIVVGCNYHTTWQSNKEMRFVLLEVKEGRARLGTRRTRKEFWTPVSDLIFIMSRHNLGKAKEYIKLEKESPGDGNAIIFNVLLNRKFTKSCILTLNTQHKKN